MTIKRSRACGSFNYLYKRLLSFGADEALFLEGAQGLGAYLERDLLAIYNNGLGLQVWLPNLLGVALREADVVAELLPLPVSSHFCITFP